MPGLTERAWTRLWRTSTRNDSDSADSAVARPGWRLAIDIQTLRRLERRDAVGQRRPRLVVAPLLAQPARGLVVDAEVVPEHHPVDRPRRLGVGQVLVRHVRRHSLGVTLERVAEAAADRRFDAYHIARGERHVRLPGAERLPAFGALALDVHDVGRAVVAPEEAERRDRGAVEAGGDHAVLGHLDVAGDAEAAAPAPRSLGPCAQAEGTHDHREGVLQRLRRLRAAVGEGILDAGPAVLGVHAAPAALRV